MSRFPLLSAKEVIAILEKMGFNCKRQRGSHIFLEHPDGRTTIIPNHPGEKLDRGLLIKIVKHDLGLEREEFLKYI